MLTMMSRLEDILNVFLQYRIYKSTRCIAILTCVYLSLFSELQLGNKKVIREYTCRVLVYYGWFLYFHFYIVALFKKHADVTTSTRREFNSAIGKIIWRRKFF